MSSDSHATTTENDEHTCAIYVLFTLVATKVADANQDIEIAGNCTSSLGYDRRGDCTIHTLDGALPSPPYWWFRWSTPSGNTPDQSQRSKARAKGVQSKRQHYRLLARHATRYVLVMLALNW